MPTPPASSMRRAIERDRQLAGAAAAVQQVACRRRTMPACGSEDPRPTPSSMPSGSRRRALAAVADRDADPAVVVAPTEAHRPFAAAAAAATAPAARPARGSADGSEAPAGEAAIVGPAAEVAGAQRGALVREPAQRGRAAQLERRLGAVDAPSRAAWRSSTRRVWKVESRVSGSASRSFSSGRFVTTPSTVVASSAACRSVQGRVAGRPRG